MSWRYQPVWTEDPGGKCLSLIEAYFDKAGRFDSWTENCAMTPVGNDESDLRGVLVRMLVDAMCWKPVNFADLKPGMEFERAVSQEEREKLADMLDALP